MNYKDALQAWNQAERKAAELEAELLKLSEEYRVKALSRFHEKQNGNDPGDRSELDEISEREKAANEAYTRAKIESGIYRDNARAALLAELKPAALEILKKYSGKAYGEKTREKISKEAAEKTGYYMTVSHDYYCSEISFYGNNYRDPWRHNDQIKLNFYDGNNSENKPILEENKIRLDSFDALHDPRQSEIVEDPAQRAAEIIDAYRAAQEAANAWKAARDKYNHLIPATVCKRIEYNDDAPRYLLN